MRGVAVCRTIVRKSVFDHHVIDCRISHRRRAMTIEPWRATCIQTKSKLAVKAPDRAGAWAIINDNIAHVIGLIEAATRDAGPPDLVVLPEFSLQGPPHGLPAAEWIEKACCPVPGAITEPLQTLARRHRLYIGGHHARPRTWSTSSARMWPKASGFRGMARCRAGAPTSSTISAGHWPTRTAPEKPRRSRR